MTGTALEKLQDCPNRFNEGFVTELNNVHDFANGRRDVVFLAHFRIPAGGGARQIKCVADAGDVCARTKSTPTRTKKNPPFALQKSGVYSDDARMVSGPPRVLLQIISLGGLDLC